MLLFDLIIKSCLIALKKQGSNGSFKSGCNGPYNDQETPVRNTSHWLITLLKGYELTGEPKFKLAAERAANYLISQDACPMDASFFCRKNPQKDFCNGLIGQAWVIEALTTASRILNDERYIRKAEKVFCGHFFDENLGLWKILNVDGSYAGFDLTFNHQLWFAMSGALIGNALGGEIMKQVECFLDRAVDAHFRIAFNGRIIHLLSLDTAKYKAVRAVNTIFHPIKYQKMKTRMKYKEIGYHAFNLYAFAVLYAKLPEHPIWTSKKFIRSLSYIGSKEFIDGIDNNLFGYPYNPTGFEIAYILQEFCAILSKHHRTIEWWISQQLIRCFDFDSGLMMKNTADSDTHAARLYEATRLDNFTISLTQ
ncbi:hypothetical protein [uncultured Desulfuromonas sp.]|uniref:hypothetical protein n=1 Tax=uncultured Desulfuromonas sp. TaxID=181013 RepID=UPI002AAB6BE2|nr:hypothetical protein [uncultured Desulfuromonas sp.]